MVFEKQYSQMKVTVNKEEFLRYEACRRSGQYNMFGINNYAKKIGLGRFQVLLIMEKYNEMYKTFIGEKKL